MKTLSLLPFVGAASWLLRHARSQSKRLVRPPGARDEAAFLSACIRCQQCVEACPRKCLVAAHTAEGCLNLATPHVVPRRNPCDLCAGQEALRCIAACPTMALLPVADRSAVRMGIAVIDPQICLPFLGVACKACWHACPFPNDAIRFDPRGRPVVIPDACVGCGLCEHACLATQPAIVVRPG